MADIQKKAEHLHQLNKLREFLKEKFELTDEEVENIRFGDLQIVGNEIRLRVRPKHEARQ